MNTEALIRQAVKNTIEFVGCTESGSPRYVDGQDTWKWEFPVKERNNDVDVFINRVMYHFNAIQYELAEKERKSKIIPVDMNELEREYRDGYETGMYWKETYIPGGPFHFGAGEHESDRHKAIAAQSQGEWAAWMQGFHDARKSAGYK